MDKPSGKGELQTESCGKIDRPVVLPDCYDGNNNFDTWVSHFEYISEINGWTDDQKLLWVCISLKGRAHMAYNCFSDEIRVSYLAVKEALQE